MGGGGDPVFKNQIPVCGELMGWRGTGRPNLSHETEFSGPNGDKNNMFPVPLTTGRVGNQTAIDLFPTQRHDHTNLS